MLMQICTRTTISLAQRSFRFQLIRIQCNDATNRFSTLQASQDSTLATMEEQIPCEPGTS